MAEPYSYSSLEDDNSSVTEQELSSVSRTDDEHCDTPLARGGRSFSEHEIADETVQKRVYLDSLGDKKRPRQKDKSVRSPPSKNPDLKKSMRRRRSSSTMDVDQPDPQICRNLDMATADDDRYSFRSPPSKNPDLKKSMRRRRSSSTMDVDQPDPQICRNLDMATVDDDRYSFRSPPSSSSRSNVPDLISTKTSPSKTYDPKLRPGVTPSSLSPNSVGALDPNWPLPPTTSGIPYNPNLRPGVTDLSERYASASGYTQPLSPRSLLLQNEAHGSRCDPSFDLSQPEASGSGQSPSRRRQSEAHGSLFASEFDVDQPPDGHGGATPRRKLIQRQISDDGVDADREDDGTQDDNPCTSPNRGQKKILKMKKTLDDKLYYRSTVDPIYLETSDNHKSTTKEDFVDVVALLKDRTREQLRYRSEPEVKSELMHLTTNPHEWLDGIIDNKVLKSLNLVQLLIAKFILSPVKSSLPSILKANADPLSGAVPKFQPIEYQDSPFNTGDEEEQKYREKQRRQSPKKKAEAMGMPRKSYEDMKNLERVADRIIQECSERGGASGSGPSHR